MFRVLALSLFVFLVACGTLATSTPTPPAPTSTPQSPLSSLNVGWAYEAYPDASSEKMLSDFSQMRDNGANTVWLGHNNPGQVDATKVEPGLSYAIYAALQDQDNPLYTDARAMADAVTRALNAAKQTHLQVVLPIGYQIQMGSAWEQKHPNDLRLTFNGQPLNLYNSGYTASPYSAAYRADISRYYEWIQTTYVEPYHNEIVLLNLADEPMGGDYSVAAKQAFAERYGKAMEQLTADEQWKIGEFESGVIADYAAWSANEWKRINPNILTTMSFHGGDTARRVWGLPDVEKLFSQTPDNFIVTFDAYLHDDLPTKPATADQAAQLKLFLSTIGNYSRIYHKPIALWGGVNAWGLAQESSAPLQLSDAITNLLLLYDVPSRAGGNVWGVFAWNYNVKQQGLENYSRPTTFDLHAMQIAVERVFPLLRVRQIESHSPDVAVIVPPRTMYNALAKTHAAGEPPAWFDTTLYARALADRDAVIVTSPQTLDAVSDATYFIVTASAGDLDDATLRFLHDRFNEGKIFLTPDPSLARTWNIPTQSWQDGLAHLPQDNQKIYLYQ